MELEQGLTAGQSADPHPSEAEIVPIDVVILRRIMIHQIGEDSRGLVWYCAGGGVERRWKG